MSKNKLENIDILWKDRKRFLGMPLSFTKYSITDDRLFMQTGFLNIKIEEILLYRIKDISLNLPIGQRIFGCGSIVVKSSDQTMPVLTLAKIKRPVAVKELLHKKVEENKNRKRIMLGEISEHNADDNELGENGNDFIDD